MSNPPPFAEYPRPEYGPSGYDRPPGVYFEAIGEAWNLVRKDLGHWVAATVVLAVITFALTRPINILTESLLPRQGSIDDMMTGLGVAIAAQLGLSIIPMAVQQVLLVGMVSMGVRKARGEYINVSMIFEPFRRFGSLFLTTLLFTLVTYASSLACCLPYLFFVPVLILMPTVAYLKQLGPFDALSLTFDICKAHWAGLLALLIVLTVIVLAGLFACLVGALITIPLAIVTLSIHYRAFFESSPA